jgi:hypothetical protein
VKYSLSSRQTAEYLRQADEIHVNQIDHKIIPTLAEQYPEARINLRLNNDSEPINWTEIKTYNTLCRKNFILSVEKSEQVRAAQDLNIPFYHRAPLYSFQEVRDLVNAGAAEVVLGAPLFFQLEKVQRNFPSVQIRAIANLALPEGSLSYNNGVTGVWIRPEDVELYGAYISTLEFYGDTTQERALFRIYALEKGWSGKLNLLVQDLDNEATNRLIPPSLAEARIQCGQRCMENDVCHLCQRLLDFANPDIIQKTLDSVKNN